MVLGEVNHELTQTPWRGRSEKVWPQIAASFDALRAENDVVVFEGLADYLDQHIATEVLHGLIA
jgi:cobyric acid synthase